MMKLLSQALQNVLRIEIHGVLDGIAGGARRLHLVDGNFLVLVLLIVLEEPSDLLDAMRRELVEIIVVAVSGSSVQTAMILSSFSPCSPENPTTEQSYFSPEV